MAFVHHESRECTKSELDLFTIPATQTSIHKGQWIEYHPLSNITDTGPIEFNVSGTGEEYLDVARTQLYVKAKITNSKRNCVRCRYTSGSREPVFYIPCFHKLKFP